MFSGEFIRNLDETGRVTLPKQFLYRLEEAETKRIMLTKGFDNLSLWIFPYGEWYQFVESLTSVPFDDREGQSALRFVGSRALECKFDNAGRILLPKNLRNFAKLISEVAIIGAINRIEIWDITRWQNYFREDNDILERILSKTSYNQLNFKSITKSSIEEKNFH